MTRPAGSAPRQLELFPAERRIVGSRGPAANAPAAAPAVVDEPQAERSAAAAPAVAGRSQAAPETVAGVDLGDRGARVLARRLGALLEGRLRSLTLTRNRSRIVSGRSSPDGAALEVRIHRCFVDAPDETLEAVVAILDTRTRKRSPKRRRAQGLIREHFARHGPGQAPAPPRRLILRPVGEFLDLRQVRDELNREYFEGAVEVAITWGRAAGRRRRRCRGFSLLLGSYDERRNLIRIHRCLNRAGVPRYVVESVVHHEMLHAVMPPEVKNGRRRLHTPEFRRRERLFGHYDKAERWLEANLERLAGLK